jgi:hypothetical protein
MATFLTDTELKATIANILQQDPAAMPSFWDDIITNANNAAYQDIYTNLVRRGFTIAQVVSWDRGKEFQKDIGTYWALLRGGALGAFGEGYKGLDRRKELEAVELTINGIWQQPGGIVGGLENTFAQIATGDYNTGTDMFVPDMQDLRRGQITQW